MPRMKRSEGVGAVWSDDLTSPNALKKRGAVAGTLATAAGPPGKKTATYFGGVGSYSQRAPQFGTGSFTVEVWANSDDITQSGRGIVTNNTGVGGAGTGWWIYFNGSNVFAYVDDGANWRFVASGDIATSTWHHAAMVVDRVDNVMRLYVDGVLKGTSATIAAFGTFDQSTMYVGRGQNTFNGAGSEPKLWDRALSTAEILAIKEATVFRYWESLVSKWRMDDPNPRDFGFRKNGNDGTGTGLDSGNIIRGPYGGKGLELNGANEHVTVSSPTNLDFGTGDFSIAAMVRITGTGVGTRVIAAQNAFNNGWELGINVVPRLQFYIEGVLVAGASTVLSPDRWYHVVATRIAGVGSTYLDGVLESGPTALSGALATGLDLLIGARNGPAVQWPGRISDFRIFRAGLLQIQAADLFGRLKEGKS